VILILLVLGTALFVFHFFAADHPDLRRWDLLGKVLGYPPLSPEQRELP